MGLLQLVNYMHNNLYRNDGSLYYTGVTFGTDNYEGIIEGGPYLITCLQSWSMIHSTHGEGGKLQE